MANMLIKADVVVGEDVAETTVEQTVYLEFPATFVTDVVAKITGLECEVIENGVVIRGAIHKQIFYVGPDSKVYHQAEDVSFDVLANVPGAEAGMHCQVTPTVQDVEWRLIAPLPSVELRQRVMLIFFVKVTRQEQLDVVLGTTGPLYKVERVVAEGTESAVVDESIFLPFAAEKVRSVRATIQDYTATACEDQVVVDGTMCIDVFFIAAFDHQEYYHRETFPFTVAVSMPGVQPGETVHVVIGVTKTTYNLDGSEVDIKVVLSLAIKVTDTTQTMLCTDPQGPLIKVGRVAGENTKEILVEDRVCLDVPTKKVEDVVAAISSVSYEVIRGKVVVDGTIHKQIFHVGPNDVVRHQAVDIPFTAVVEIPSAEPGMAAQVHPTIEHVSWSLIHETPDCPLPDYYDGIYADLFRVVDQRIVLQLFVKVTEWVQINVCLVPPRPPQG